MAQQRDMFHYKRCQAHHREASLPLLSSFKIPPKITSGALKDYGIHSMSLLVGYVYSALRRVGIASGSKKHLATRFIYFLMAQYNVQEAQKNGKPKELESQTT